MPKTNLGMEFQITKEYLGFATHLVYLGPLFEESPASRHLRQGSGLDRGQGGGRQAGQPPLTLMAGVANIGRDRNWSGSQFDQANWYVFGRLAWDPDASTQDIAADWAQDDLLDRPAFRPTDRGDDDGLARGGRGLHDPAGPAPPDGPQPPLWPRPLGDRRAARRLDQRLLPPRPASDGIGFDRTATGSNATAQYAPVVAKRFSDPKTIDERDLLWFHHLPWTYKLKNGQTLWDGLVTHYSHGVATVDGMNNDLGGPFALCRRRAPRPGRRLPGHPAQRGPVVARRLDRLFPDLLGPAAAGRRSGPGPFAGLLRGPGIPVRAWGRLNGIIRVLNFCCHPGRRTA